MERVIETRQINGLWVAYPVGAHMLCYGIAETEQGAKDQLWELFADHIAVREETTEEEYPLLWEIPA